MQTYLKELLFGFILQQRGLVGKQKNYFLGAVVISHLCNYKLELKQILILSEC